MYILLEIFKVYIYAFSIIKQMKYINKWIERK